VLISRAASALRGIDRREDEVKKLALALIAAGALVFGAATAAAANGGADVQTFPVSFVLDSASCSNLPAGTTVTGTGTGTSITVVRTDRNGVTTIINSTHAFGTATDQDGNTYVFDYNNEFRVSDTTATPGAFSGVMTDHFSLAGPGPAHLVNGFLANIDFSTFTFDPINSRGDPIDFATGAAHCDPL
jgi:hypothetical protein